jgi:hypothetical protein
MIALALSSGRNTVYLALFIFGMLQQKPALGRRPTARPQKIEVRFAKGTETVTCDTFYMHATVSGKPIISGFFERGVDVPRINEADFSKKTAVVDLGCGHESWHFVDVPVGAFVSGWWWVGTDFPPFQAEFSGNKFDKCKMINYLMVDPEGSLGFDLFNTIPVSSRNLKTPCTD